MDRSELAQLTKKERKAYFKEQRQLEELKSYKRAHIKKWLIIALVVATVALGAWLLVKELTKPLPGQFIPDLGRDHVPQEQWEKYKYNSNPPTSGPHDAEWTRAGVYDSPQGDGHLVHSLEHGYIIISYNCRKLISNFKFQISNVYAHGDEEEPVDSIDGKSLGKEWETKECKNLKHSLSDLAEEKRLWKLIVVPRPNMDTAIAITAWTRIDTMDAFDEERIGRFIDVFRDKGPEKTME